MKIAIIGAAGVRTPLIVQAIRRRQDRLGITELSLMDIDGDRLELIGALTAPLEQAPDTKFAITRTTNPRQALQEADFVITTFRVGGIESRVIDERVPLSHGILGQETTGPGGFAMGIRSIPVILDYVSLMQEVCPQAWLINFANPAGMLTEAVVRKSSWQKVVGICDGPASMHQVISAILRADPEEVYLDYFGLNHLGWIKRIILHDHDMLPEIIEIIKTAGNVPGLPIEPGLIASLGMIPNEYLYYYYSATQAVSNILKASESRGEYITRQNLKLFDELRNKFNQKDIAGMQSTYQTYLGERGSTYMVTETGKEHDLSALAPEIVNTVVDEGYAGVALNLIERLGGNKPRRLILNIPNQDKVTAFDAQDVLEIPCLVTSDQIQPLPVRDIPDHCLGLMLQVKQYERWTIEAAVAGSYQKARLALTSHPLVRDYALAGILLDEYCSLHKAYFPTLK
jgi:6-phospho-beta-glucosidase